MPYFVESLSVVSELRLSDGYVDREDIFMGLVMYFMKEHDHGNKCETSLYWDYDSFNKTYLLYQRMENLIRNYLNWLQTKVFNF
jgi:hypothetical protein